MKNTKQNKMETRIAVAVAGASGKMGRMLIKAVDENPMVYLSSATCHPSEKDIEGKDAGLIAGIESLDVSISSNPKSLLNSEVIIDFTSPEATINHAEIASKNNIAHVIGTTGLSEKDEKLLSELSILTQIFYSANMSLGVNLLLELINNSVSKLGNDWDIEIIEMHHKQKIDAPSGTALSLGKEIAKSLNKNFNDIAVYSREGRIGPRKDGEIGFAVLRGGSVVGDHTVILSNGDERIELCHKAGNRSIFANGAIKAAIWIVKQKPGLYSMKNIFQINS